MSDPISRLNAALEGRYRIEVELGEGGMATVYLARDERHNRNVALKVLKPELAAVVGAERFLAEIETTANLQHPHILPLFDSGEVHGFLYYVMPYVAGESLRERLDREHQLPVDEAVQIATNVAEALDYAHRQSVIHRDVKPANILLQADKPVISDFGIALAVSVGGGNRLTETGLSLGTPHYMSPEQATGDLNVGPATDIYALGCVLYEMLVGEPPYTGSTPQAVLGRIITADPPSVSAERRSVPANVDAAISKALEKLPADRFNTGSDLVSALRDAGFRHGDVPRVDGAAVRLWRRGTLAASLLAVLFGGLAAYFRHVSGDAPEAAGRVERFPMPFLPGQEAGFLESGSFSLSPDGTMLVYRHGGGSLMVRRWAELASTPVRESRGAANPEVSPDGLEVAFVRDDTVKVMALAGGPVRSLVEGCCPEWGPDGFVYATTDSGTVRVPATGGDDVQVVTRLAEGERRHRVSDVLPNGRRVLLWVLRQDGSGEIRGLDLKNGETTTIGGGTRPRYLPEGYLLVYQDDLPPATLMAARFDPERMEMLGAPVPVINDVRGYSLSHEGTLYYTYGSAPQLFSYDEVLQLMWVTRSGQATPIDPGWTFIQGGSNTGWSLSPDGTMLALREHTADGNDIWVKRLDTGPSWRLTFHEDEDRKPVWAPDGRNVAFISNRSGGLDVWWKPFDGTGDTELLLDHDEDIAAVAWSPGGEWLLARTSGPGGSCGWPGHLRVPSRRG